MKILIDTELLINALTQPAAYPDASRVIELLLESESCSLWISALSLAHLQHQCDLNSLSKAGRDRLERILEQAAVIPFRRDTFRRAVGSASGRFTPAAMLAAAAEMKIQAIVADQPAPYPAGDIPVMDAPTFLERHASGTLQPIEKVPFLDLAAQLHQVYTDVDASLTEIIATNGFILGKYVETFEHDFAAAHDVRHALAVSSGTDALHIALIAFGIGTGDTVALPVNTFIATAEAVSLTGARPVFVDCDAYYNIDVQQLERLFDEAARGRRPMPKVVIPVHLYGQPADMDPILDLANKYGAAVVEDACQAHLARYKGRSVGTLGRLAAFSFYPGKNLGAYGEGGALICDDEALFTAARMVRQHGEIERYHHQVVGHNYRMEAIQGAVLSRKLPHLAEWTRRRRANAALYNQGLADTPGIRTPAELAGTECVYHLYVIQADDRDALQKHLAAKGIATGLHYPLPLHLQPAYRDLGYRKGDFPTAEAAAGRILSLPMFPELDAARIQYVCDTIRAFADRQGGRS